MCILSPLPSLGTYAGESRAVVSSANQLAVIRRAVNNTDTSHYRRGAELRKTQAVLAGLT